MDFNDLQTAADGIGDALAELDNGIYHLAEQSQREVKSQLKPGDKVRAYGRRSIVTGDAATGAHALEGVATDKINGILDDLDRKASAHVTEQATADELANVSFVLDRGDVTDAELQELYDRYRDKWAIARVLRKEAAKRRIYLGAPDASDAYLENRDAIRRRAVGGVSNRWHDRAGEIAVVPPSIVASDLLDHMAGIDLFGNPR